jgi:hypothetical protein
MPAQAGICLCLCCKAKKSLDSGPGSSPGQALRRNDESKSRPLVGKFRTPRLIAWQQLLHHLIQNYIGILRPDLRWILLVLTGEIAGASGGGVAVFV